MGFTVLRDVLENWTSLELDDQVYLHSDGEPALDTPVTIYPYDPALRREFEGRHYLLGIEQIRNVVERLDHQLGRRASPLERLRAVNHFAKHDAFIDPQVAVAS